MDAILTVFFTLAYLVLAFFLAVMGAKEGPDLLFYFVLGYLLIAEGALWWWYFFLRRRRYKHKRWMLVGGALGLAAGPLGHTFRPTFSVGHTFLHGKAPTHNLNVKPYTMGQSAVFKLKGGA